jgi:hypothetical protein
MNRKYDTLFERLVANTEEPENERACWNWKGARLPKGYGRVNMRDEAGKHRPRYAHREMEHCMRGENEFDLDDDPLGPIFYVPRPRLGSEETLDHLCYNPGCANPDHWEEPVSRAENTLRAHQRRWRL